MTGSTERHEVAACVRPAIAQGLSVMHLSGRSTAWAEGLLPEHHGARALPGRVVAALTCAGSQVNRPMAWAVAVACERGTAGVSAWSSCGRGHQFTPLPQRWQYSALSPVALRTVRRSWPRRQQMRRITADTSDWPAHGQWHRAVHLGGHPMAPVRHRDAARSRQRSPRCAAAGRQLPDQRPGGHD